MRSLHGSRFLSWASSIRSSFHFVIEGTGSAIVKKKKKKMQSEFQNTKLKRLGKLIKVTELNVFYLSHFFRESSEILVIL